jgi:hypothetical protein
VPGVKYVLRDRGVQELKKAGINPAGSLIFDLFRALNRVGVPVFRSFVPLKLFNLTFFERLVNTRFVYTARGGFGIAVRKFFEIPAAGAVMLCAPPLGFAELGFKNDEHFVECQPEDLPKALKALEADMERSQAVARAGQRLVLTRHSLSARAGQFAACLDAIVAGAFAGAHWMDGEFKVNIRQRPREAAIVD